MSDKSGEGQAKAGRGGNVPPPHARWKKGQSGNPKGMPPKTETQKQLAEVIKAYLNETDAKNKTRLRKLLEKLSKINNEKGARLMLEYGFGKVAEKVLLDGSGEVTVRVVYGANGSATDSSPKAE